MSRRPDKVSEAPPREEWVSSGKEKAPENLKVMIRIGNDY